MYFEDKYLPLKRTKRGADLVKNVCNCARIACMSNAIGIKIVRNSVLNLKIEGIGQCMIFLKISKVSF